MAALSNITIPRSRPAGLIYDGLAEPADGFVTMDDAPGLGFELNRDRLESFVI